MPSRRSQKQIVPDNMKNILLAFHNFAAANGRLPASATYGADGQPKLSWRVALLPYLDQNELYNEFHQDEPWDSPHNSTLIVRMPAVFETPGAPPVAAGQTRIRGFAGKGAMFEGTQGIAFSDVTDGMSNTLMIAVAAEPTPWTRPGELPFVAGQALSALDDSDGQGCWVGMGDGSLQRVPKERVRLLAALITRAGGEVVQWPGRYADPTTVRVYRPTKDQLPTAGRLAPMPTPAPPTGGIAPMVVTSPEALEHRLAVVEQKLDLLIRKLDAALREGDLRRSGPGSPGGSTPRQ